MNRPILESACVLACLAVLAPAEASPAAQAPPKPRLLVLTDIGGDPDDQQSMVRLMVTSNEFDVEGLVATSRLQHGTDVRPDLIRDIVNGYGQVRANLLLHRPGYPTKDFLLGKVKSGNPNFGTAAVGSAHDTEGSNWIVSVVDQADSRPLNVSIWGGSTDLAQALWRVRNDRTAAQLDAFVAKLRVHAIGDQDNTAPWILQNFPKLWYIRDLYAPDKYQSPYRGMYLGGDTSIRNAAWVSTNVRTGHGALGALYPASAPGSDGVKEGDTPSWFYFLPSGLHTPSQPGWGGWGGRFSGSGPHFASDALDAVGTETSRRATVWRWRPAFQNDFQARMDWCVKPANGANHPPAAAVAGGLSRTVAPGAAVTLDASGSTDPDGNARSYAWWWYREPGSYAGPLTLNNSASAVASFTAPSVTSPKTIHIVLEVKDNGAPPLTSYARVVVTVDPNAGAPANQAPSPRITQPAADGQAFAAGSTLSFAGDASDPEDGTLSGGALTWHIDRIGDGFAAAKLAATGGSGSRALSGSINNPSGQAVQLGVVGSDYDLILRAVDSAGASAEVKRRYRVSDPGSPAFSVTIDSVSTGRPYSLGTARPGALYYIDRSYTIASLSAALDGGVLLRTANDDKRVTASSHLAFTVSGSATVYVGYDKRGTAIPSWLQGGWTAVADAFAVSDGSASPLRVYRKSVPAGPVTLGGNLAGGAAGAQSHYVVVVQPAVPSASTLSAAAIPEDVWDHPGDSDGDGLMDDFEWASFTDPAKADTDGDGEPDESELDALGRTLWEAQEAARAPSGGGGGSGGSCGALGLEALGTLLFRRRRAKRAGREDGKRRIRAFAC